MTSRSARTAVAASSTGPKRPQIRVRPGTRADLPELLRVYFDAFDPIVVNKLLYPGGTSASAMECFAKDFWPEEKKTLEAEAAEAIFMQERSEIVAFGKWNHVKEPQPEEKWNVHKPATQEGVGEGVNVLFFEDFIGGLQKLRRKYMKGDPCLHLEILAVTTTRQRLGAGSALLAWGNQFADNHGYTYWLEASPQGYPLYRRFGFEAIEPHDVDLAPYGAGMKPEDEDWGASSGADLVGPLAEGHFRTMVMRRDPQRS
ncbi:N-acetyltransferase-like protein [Coniella lustricola]|uniref:N-acetyltransferase-like protein n=1 Tax=Coniella lustricola TaxID=2025994 RepID=A0A2T3AB48_9PEZI|nr:N-acetyltransferase-like protein [Coniella lustricola]